ncbi:glycosyltransferase [Candidatus Sumerlaeota bacterium]|nr:glycosyltransferase [Candidatus Sumerlaeota bacterium]
MIDRRFNIAFVVQRYGSEVLGGAETLCRMYAEALSPHCHVETLTTCARDYETWNNHYPAGVSEERGVRIRRFPVDHPRETGRFNRVDRSITRNAHWLVDEHQWMRLQGPVCTRLTRFIEERRNHYDAFVFFGYLYATTFYNLAAVQDRAWLFPFTHDEPPVYLRIFEQVFRNPRCLFFLTPEERDFTQRRFGPWLPDGEVLGVGLAAQTPVLHEAVERFRHRHGLNRPYILYAGRLDPSKNADQLLRDYLALKEHWPEGPDLVLIGRGELALPVRPDIKALGYIDEQDKRAAMTDALCLALPSIQESLSIVLLESWLAGRPALVHRDCAAALGQTRRAQGGLCYRGAGEFRAAVRQLTENPAEAIQLGKQGQRYVLHYYHWPEILQKLFHNLFRDTVV